MTEFNVWAVVLAAVAGFVAAFGYYAALGGQLVAVGSTAAHGGAAVDDRQAAWVPLFELIKHLLLAAVVAGLVVAIDIATWSDALVLGLALWVGFPVVLLAGSVVHEKVPWRLAAIHAGDWFVKLLLVALIVGAWR
ncbi:MAG TPA: DUF1761 domain-containing protein [Jiangellaceae bacterium]